MPRKFVWAGWQRDYEIGDPALVGMGNPPSDPEFSRANPGAGTFPMTRKVVETATDTAGMPAESE